MIALKDPGLPLKFRITLDQTQHRIAGMLVKHQHIPADRLYRGDIGPALEAIAKAPPPPRSIKAGGDQIAAQKIASFL